MPRFHCPTPLTSGQLLDLPASAARHVQVLRLQPGDSITLFNGDHQSGGGEFDASITRMGRSDVQVQVGTHHAVEREAACTSTRENFVDRLRPRRWRRFLLVEVAARRENDRRGCRQSRQRRR